MPRPKSFRLPQPRLPQPRLPQPRLARTAAELVAKPCPYNFVGVPPEFATWPSPSTRARLLGGLAPRLERRLTAGDVLPAGGGGGPASSLCLVQIGEVKASTDALAL